ncbi:uncharacterized protein LOC134225430 [Armigeres subalbatus]|uniref:uncharacterized protein LOC134225430 n=1 Tax=Armigeres subalbatus TaxID=124917 RepID=UPI002ED16463
MHVIDSGTISAVRIVRSTRREEKMARGSVLPKFAASRIGICADQDSARVEEVDGQIGDPNANQVDKSRRPADASRAANIDIKWTKADGQQMHRKRQTSTYNLVIRQLYENGALHIVWLNSPFYLHTFTVQPQCSGTSAEAAGNCIGGV